MKRKRIVVVGAGVAGSLVTSGLADREDVEVIVLERSSAAAQLDAGTGLNIGPNALKALEHILPERAEAIRHESLTWQRWLVALTDGRVLMDLDLMEVADTPGVRIRWSALYALLREPILDQIRFGVEVTKASRTANGLRIETVEAGTGAHKTIHDVDLLIAGDGRYSAVRSSFCDADEPEYLGVALFRFLVPVGPDCPIDDYGQWFNGSNRLLAYRVPGDFIYCAGSFPIGVDEQIPERMKAPDVLTALYRPDGKPLSEQAAFLVEALRRHQGDLHWARLQDRAVHHDAGPGVVLMGDAAHPIVPTLGQGATQAVEDACELIDELRLTLAERPDDLAGVPARFAARRDRRADFVRRFSREATDTMLRDADPVAGTAKKREPAFTLRLEQLYRYSPEWGA